MTWQEGSEQYEIRGEVSVEYALARHTLVENFKRGRISRGEICDAHPELLRAGSAVGAAREDPCPVCASLSLVSVFYAFGPKLPAHGKCIASAAEVAKVASIAHDAHVYQVEVCLSCHWNHLLRVTSLG